MSFDYRSATATFNTIARQYSFETAERQRAALNSVILYTKVGDIKKMNATRKVFLDSKPSPKQKVEFDW